MSDGIYITKTDFNQLMKKIDSLEEYIRNSMRKGTQPKWIKPAEAMELIGCKSTTLKRLRLSGRIHWRYAGNGRCVMLLRSSCEKYIMDNSTVFERSSG
ncbi:MAG: hypothetical protein INR73_08700 [Williamsia sp.]|nr:hypothetical protein [Williamsia sp.]